MENGTFPYETECLNRQVLKEIDYFRSIYDLKPKVYLSYDRYAFFEKMMVISELHLTRISQPGGAMYD